MALSHSCVNCSLSASQGWTSSHSTNQEQMSSSLTSPPVSHLSFHRVYRFTASDERCRTCRKNLVEDHRVFAVKIFHWKTLGLSKTLTLVSSKRQSMKEKVEN